MNKVLIITYYWPPAGGPGVQRWLNFVKFLPEFGKEVVVYIPENPNYPMTDSSFLVEIPEGITIVKKPILEPYKWAAVFSKSKTKQISKGLISAKKQSWVEGLLLWIRGNIFIPDARKFWVKPSIGYLKTFIDQQGIQTIITTGPPHSLHLIGLGLKKWKPELQWVTDFRDPWTTIGYHTELKLSKSSQQRHHLMEKTVLTAADKIIVTSATTKEEFKLKTSKPVAVITNGYLKLNDQNVTLDQKFSMAHIGSLLSGRNPKVLWEALAELSAENKAFYKDLELVLAGTISEEVLESILKAGLKDRLQLKGYVSHQQAVDLQCSAQLLLLIEIDAEKTKGIIPGKFFEYMAARRPIIALGPKGWDVERIMKETATGEFFDYHNKEALKAHILNQYKNFRSGNLEVNAKGLEYYHRKELTKKLVEFIS